MLLGAGELVAGSVLLLGAGVVVLGSVAGVDDAGAAEATGAGVLGAELVAGA